MAEGTSAEALCSSGWPFVPCRTFSIVDLMQKERSNVQERLDDLLRIGEPFVIQHLQTENRWDEQLFSRKALFEMLSSNDDEIRDYGAGRITKDSTQAFLQILNNSGLQTKSRHVETQCPSEWTEKLDSMLPILGSQSPWSEFCKTFAQYPSTSDATVCVGTQGSSSGFHRALDSKVVVNILVDGNDKASLCFGTDVASQAKYNEFLEARGHNPFTGIELDIEQLRAADFPIYVHSQNYSDVIILPPSCAYQVQTKSQVSVNVFSSILHPWSIEAALSFLQPLHNRFCVPSQSKIGLKLVSEILQRRSLYHYPKRYTNMLARVFEPAPNLPTPQNLSQVPLMFPTPVPRISTSRLRDSSVEPCIFNIMAQDYLAASSSCTESMDGQSSRGISSLLGSTHSQYSTESSSYRNSTTSPLSRVARDGHESDNTSIMRTTSNITTPSITISFEDDIADLRSQIERLEGYAKRMLSLSLIESHASLQEELAALKRMFAQKKLEKAEELINKLAGEFPDLSKKAREELTRQRNMIRDD
ncbi:hypothetical protein G7Y89_g3216 [Cudoniella acicularis]|uniref:JmjC domain-containing protein n=1 Tax=Cudoniella acicularis TaxID=354080 RepID=A0A8H4RSM8_9HELO|nr:hypothetical protein G7Y89_g3216 [Cudoniella acicularis]